MSMNSELSSFSIFPATPEQSAVLRLRVAVEWDTRGVTADESLTRDELVDKEKFAQDGKLIEWVLASRNDPSSLEFVCSCKTFRREGLVYFQSDNGPRNVTCYAVASVFTPVRYRGKGYAAHMMRLLHWVLADTSLLNPSDFPTEWGAPPVVIANTGDGYFSTLWSDVGPKFYSRCGPTKDSEGWVVRDSYSTIWDVLDLKERLSPGTRDGDWSLIDKDGVSKLWESDAVRIARNLRLPAGDYQASFTFLPNKGVSTYHTSRNMDILANGVHPAIQYWGIVRDPDTFATWTFEIRSPHKTLLITRLSCAPSHFDEMLARVMSIAETHGMEKIEVYNLPGDLQPSATRLGGTTAERTNHLSAFKWYGEEDPSKVAWLFNEKFCWC